MLPPLIRLNKLVAASGACSRREADRYLALGWIRVQGLEPAETATPGTKVPPDTPFEFLPPSLQEMASAVSLVFHKPVGIVSGQPESPQHVPAIKLLTAENRACRRRSKQQVVSNPYRLPKLAVTGRLDAQSSGLLLFTQSGTLAQKVIGPNSAVEKEYLVRVAQTLDNGADTQDRLDCLLEGIHSDGDLLEATQIKIQNSNQLQVVLTGGKYHHIRRMCEAVDWEVQALKRVRIGPLRLQDLAVGKWRYLEPHEFDGFK
jgi:23S rRNA pseudouridine2604 synthase